MKIKEGIQYWRYVSFSFRGRINRPCWWLYFFLVFFFSYLAGVAGGAELVGGEDRLKDILTPEELERFRAIRRAGRMPDALVPKFYKRLLRDLEYADYLRKARQQQRDRFRNESPWKTVWELPDVAVQGFFKTPDTIESEAFDNALKGLFDRNIPLAQGLTRDIRTLLHSGRTDAKGNVVPLHKSVGAQRARGYLKKHHIFTPFQLAKETAQSVVEGLDKITTGQALQWGEHPLEHFAQIVIVLLFGLILCYTYLPVYIKRLHDTKGTEGDNKYGVPPQKIDWRKKCIPYLFVWGITFVILGSSDDEFLVVWLIIILIVNPIVLPRIWKFVLERIREIAKAIKGTD